MVSTPKPPDPMETAQAQAGMNRDTAITQQQLNMVNQVTPYGNLTYSQTGWNTPTGYITMDEYNNMLSGGAPAPAPSPTGQPAGQTIDLQSRLGDGRTAPGGTAGQPFGGGGGGGGSRGVDTSGWTPSYTATTTLTPEQQAILDATQGAQTNLAQLAQQQSSFLQDYLAQPVDLSNEAVESRLYELGASRLDPRFAQQEEALRTRLANQGIVEGSAAYDSAMRSLNEGRNDAYNQLLLSGRAQAMQEMLAQRNQPINEIGALLSGGQVSMPQFQSTPQTGVAGVDYTGLVNQQYQADLQRSQSAMGGLFGLLGAGITAFSDERLKDNIEQIGELDNGLGIYRYDMGGQEQVGLLAQEVEDVNPDAVVMDPSGYRRVNYAEAIR